MTFSCSSSSCYPGVCSGINEKIYQESMKYMSMDYPTLCAENDQIQNIFSLVPVQRNLNLNVKLVIVKCQERID